MFNIQFNGFEARLNTITYPERRTGNGFSFERNYLVMGRREPTTLNFITIAHNYNSVQNIWDLLEHSNWYTLGEGRVCEYCSAYNPDGRITCWYCGGSCVTLPMSKAQQANVIVDTIKVPAVVDYFSKDAPHYMYFTLRCYDELSCTTNGRYTFPLFNNYITHYRLCKFCGSVFDSKSCSMCGGQQFPLTEIVKLDRECIYCKSKVLGDVVCKGCGRIIGGMAVNELTSN